MIFFLIIFLSQSFASVIPAWDTLLERPMDTRVKELQKAKGEKAREFLTGVAFDKNAALTTRWRALTTMGRLDALGYRVEIDKALNSPEWFMRNAALIALLNDERERALNWSIKMLNDKALVVRTQAVRNLIGLNAVEAEPALWQQMFSRKNFRGDESLWIRAHVAEALARLSAVRPGRTENFHRILVDNDDRLHRWAIMGLENSTGYKMSHAQESIEVRRQKWLSRSQPYL